LISSSGTGFTLLYLLFYLGILISSGTPDFHVKMEPEIEGKPWRGLEVKSNLRKSYNEHNSHGE